MEYRNLIDFIPAGKSDREVTKQETKTSSQSLTGDEAKSFYENLIQDSLTSEAEECLAGCQPSIRSNSTKGKRKEQLKTAGTTRSNRRSVQHDSESETETRALPSGSCEKSGSLTERLGHTLLRFAEHGQLREVQRSIQAGQSVDFQDVYGWTALMCAARAGRSDVVDCLLEAGANSHLCNNQDQTALHLARGTGRKDIIETLNHWMRTGKRKCSEEQQATLEPFHCSVCKREFSDSTEKAHQSSTVHLFNRKLKPKPDLFMIPTSNVGFQLMRKSGWDGEKGLGPDGSGQKYPVKTTLKRDRSCLGSTDNRKTEARAKVTHFGPNDTKAIQSIRASATRVESVKSLSKKAQKRKEKKAKEWERDLRQYMNTD